MLLNTQLRKQKAISEHERNIINPPFAMFTPMKENK